MTTTPNPGSVEALRLGCRCPVLDNGHGKRPGAWGWTINLECPVHAHEPQDEAGAEA